MPCNKAHIGPIPGKPQSCEKVPDLQDTTLKISNFCKDHGHNLICIGLPKTIDNDVYPISQTLGSLTAASVTSILAMIIATPIVVMISQYRSRYGDIFEKVTLTLYGLPHIAVGISMLFITIKIFPSIYQTFVTLIISYLIVFLPQAVGGGQASMEQVKLSYIEASSGLGISKIDTFYKITFPLIYRGLLAGAALVFLSTMKELPQTLLLRPTGFSTMAVDIWSNASEALFTQAAFSAFILLAISAFPTYILSTRNLTN